MLELLDPEFKIMILMPRALMNKSDSMPEEMDKVSK